LKRKYNICSEVFNLDRIKINHKYNLFLNTDLPAMIFMSKESPNISNFNIKECLGLVNINPSESVNPIFAFIFSSQIFFGRLSNSQSQNIVTKQMSKQIHNLHNLPSLNLLTYLIEEQNIYSLLLVDKHLNEVSRFSLTEFRNEVCTNFCEISNFYEESGKKLFALGTGIVEDTSIEPELGHIFLIELDENLKLNKVGEIETKGGVYKIASRSNLLFVGSASTLYVYLIEKKNKNLNSTQLEMKLLRKNNEFTIINDIMCHDEYIVISDIYKSISIFKFDEEKEKLQELCRDFSPIWCYSMSKIENNMYLITDIDGNIFGLRREMHPKSDEEKYQLERMSQFNLGERINKLVNVKKAVNSKDWENIFGAENEKNTEKNVFNRVMGGAETNLNTKGEKVLNITYFGTLEGSLGVIITLPKETFEYLHVLQTEILKVISSTGNFDYEKWRAFKVFI
jgi:hypothetical protein